MDVARIEGNRLGNTGSVVGQREKQRVDLHSNSAFVRGGSAHIDLSALTAKNDPTKDVDTSSVAPPPPVSLRMPDGTRIESPMISDEHRKALAHMVNTMSQEDRKEWLKAALEMGRQMLLMSQAQADGGLNAGSAVARSSGMQSATEKNFEQNLISDSQQSYEDSVTSSLLAGSYGFESQINDYLARFQYEQEMSDELRVDIAELAGMIEDWPEGETQTVTYHEVVINEKGEKFLVERTAEVTKEEAQHLMKSLEEAQLSLDTLDPAQQQIIQVIVHGWQQSITTLSNIMKIYDENLRNILQNAKA